MKTKKSKKYATVALDKWLVDLCDVLHSANPNSGLMDHRLGDVASAAAVLCNEEIIDLRRATDDPPEVCVIDLPDGDDDGVLDPEWCHEAVSVLQPLDLSDATYKLFGLTCLLRYMAWELEVDARGARPA